MAFLQTHIQDKQLVVKLNRGKVNAINAALVTELRELIAHVNQNSDIHGVVLVGQTHYFSAGLDVVELFNYDDTAIRNFWISFMHLLADLLASPKPWVAAINGHSPAGGCILALCCDYRVMAAGDYQIGLNEVPVGVVVPTGAYELYAGVIGAHLAYQYLLEGRLVSASQALDIGLVDEVVALDAVLAHAQKKLSQYLNLNPVAWQLSKQNFRAALVNLLRDTKALEPTLTQWWSKETRASLQVLVDRLTTKN